MAFALTTDFLPALINNTEVVPPREGIVLQIVEIQSISSNVADPTTGRARCHVQVVLNDGVRTYHSWLATQHHYLIADCTIRVNTIVKLVECSQHTNDTNDERVLIIDNLRVLGYAEEKITTVTKVNVPVNAGAVILPIADITPYQSRWTIKARCTNKTPVKMYQNATGKGKLMSVDFSDAQDSTIRATMFHAAVDKFGSILEIGKVYQCSNMRAKPANKQFNNTGHEYELTINGSSIIVPVDDDSSIKTISYNRTGIADLVNLPTNSSVDVLGIVSHVGPVCNVATQNGPQRLCTVSVYDHTKKSIDIALWGEMTDAISNDKMPINSVVLFKTARVSHYQGRSLNIGVESTVLISPQVEEASALLDWSQAQAAQGGALPFDSLSGNGAASAASGGNMTGDLKTIAQIANEGLGMHGQPDDFLVRGVVTLIRHQQDKPPFYRACPNQTQKEDQRTGERKTRTCGKIVTDGMIDDFYCDQCRIVVKTYETRYLLSLVVADSTGSVNMCAFNEVGQKLLSGKSANEMARLLKENPAAYEAVFSDSLHKQFTFKCRATADTYQGEQRSQITVMQCMPVNFESDCRALLSSLSQIYQ